jgi:hypothetical protein
MLIAMYGVRERNRAGVRVYLTAWEQQAVFVQQFRVVRNIIRVNDYWDSKCDKFVE